MSSTFKSWLIANLGLTFVGVTALMIVLTFLFHGLNESRIVIIFAFVAFITAEIFEMPNTLFTILSCIVFLCIQFFLVVKLMPVSLMMAFLNVLFLILGIGGGTKVGAFTHENFFELVSRRMQWRNSNVDMFEVKWKYVFNRFASSAALFYMFLLEVVMLFSPNFGTTMLKSVFS